MSPLPFVNDVNPSLQLEGNAAKSQLYTQGAVVSRFEIARAKMAMDLNRSTDDTKQRVFDVDR